MTRNHSTGGPSEAAFDLLRRAFDAGWRAAQAAHCLKPHLPPHLAPSPAGRAVVVGAGKAAAAMAEVVADRWPGPIAGLVVTRYGHGRPAGAIEVVEAAHPVPDRAGTLAAERILDLAAGLGPGDLLLCLLSGGGSALLTLPAPGLDLGHKRAVTDALLRSGAAIAEINCVRKHLSAIKGGRLGARAHPARVLSLIVSDVVGDDLAAIASGPTVADPTTFAMARDVLARYHITPPAAVARHLARAEDETPKPGDARLKGVENRIVASAGLALKAAAGVVAAAGYRPVPLGDDLIGEARELGRRHAAMALAYQAEGTPVALISGGEATVTVRGAGRGGPNAEYALGLAVALARAPGIHALACDTDGIDGSADNAGAVIGPGTLARGAARGLDAETSLAENDAHGYFAASAGLVITGPTLTNVNDLRIILVDPLE